MKASDILSKAADLIEPEGKWGRGGKYANPQCMCAVEAIGTASNCDQAAFVDARDTFRDFIGATTVVGWNDDPERTQSEVVCALRQAASLAKERESAQ